MMNIRVNQKKVKKVLRIKVLLIVKKVQKV